MTAIRLLEGAVRRHLVALLATLAPMGVLLGAGPTQAEPEHATGPVVLLLDRDGALVRFDDRDPPPAPRHHARGRSPGRGSSAVTPWLRGCVTDAHRTLDGGLVVATERALLRFGPDGTHERLARGVFTGAAVTTDGGVVASFRFDLPHTRDLEETGGLVRVDPTTAGLSEEESETFPEDVVVLGEAP